MALTHHTQEQALRQALTGSTSKDLVYRNYYFADPYHHSWDTLLALEARGFMRRGKMVGDGTYFHCTEAGALHVGLHLPTVKTANDGT